MRVRREKQERVKKKSGDGREREEEFGRDDAKKGVASDFGCQASRPGLTQYVRTSDGRSMSKSCVRLWEEVTKEKRKP